MHTLMAPSRPQSLNDDTFDALFADRKVSGVLLDRSGSIVYVSPGWKAFAQEAGLALPDFGIGQSYLRHCAYADQESARVIEGITQLLVGQVDCLSFIYPCQSPTELRWFLLLGFPRVKNVFTALLHIDITAFMPAGSDKLDPVILVDRFGASSPPSLRGSANESPTLPKAIIPAREVSDIERAIVSSDARGASQPSLSKRQQEVLGLMAKGLSNVEIGRALAISPNTVKIHVSGILARLGLPSRAQAIHWTLTRNLDQRRRSDA